MNVTPELLGFHLGTIIGALVMTIVPAVLIFAGRRTDRAWLAGIGLALGLVFLVGIYLGTGHKLSAGLFVGAAVLAWCYLRRPAARA